MYCKKGRHVSAGDSLGEVQFVVLTTVSTVRWARCDHSSGVRDAEVVGGHDNAG